MSLRPPRRIFRASPRAAARSARRGRLPAAIWAGLAGGALGALIMMLALPAELLGRVPVLAGTITAVPERVAVVDGETLVLNETIIRLDGITAPLRGQACHGDNGTGDDGTGTDCGGAATAALASLVRGRDVECRLNGRDRDGFARGICTAAGQELNRTLVATGWARARADMPGLNADEAAAKAAHRGLWRGTTP